MADLPAMPPSCTTCGLEVRHVPTIHLGLAFCCAGCAADGPCTCSYDEEPLGEYRHAGASASAGAGEPSGSARSTVGASR